MRPLPIRSYLSRSALVLATLFSFVPQSDARIGALPHFLDHKTDVRSGVILVQSQRQKRSIESFLEDNGFEKPNYVPTTPPRYFVESCRDNKKYLLMFKRNGDYFGWRRLGECEKEPPVVSLLDLRMWMEDRNYSNIRFTERSAPNRVAEACRDGRQYTIRFDAAGKATERRNWFGGDCKRDDVRPTFPTASVTRREARTALRRTGYNSLRFDRNFSDSKLVEACQGVRKFRLLLGVRGRVRARRAVGFCQDAVGNVNFVPPKPDLESIEDSRGPLNPVECQLVLNWLQYSNPIVFETASEVISRESRSLLRTIADNVERCPGTRLRIEGHTDSIGSARFNLKLSMERADAVRDFVVRSGVPRSRVMTRGFGETYPVTKNLVERDRARNRRINLVLEWGRAEDLGLARSSDSSNDDR